MIYYHTTLYSFVKSTKIGSDNMIFRISVD